MEPGRNPFAPPTAPVADVSPVGSQLARPRQVAVAVSMLSISIAAHFFKLIDAIHVIDGPAIAALAFPLLSAWLTYKIWQGRNWARVTIAAITFFGAAVTGLLLFLQQYYSVTYLAPEGHTIRLIHAVLRFGAVAFLFADPGRRWFQRPAEPSPPAQKVLS
jgi:hypothetical protein